MALKWRIAFGVAVAMAIIAVAVLPPRSCSATEDWTISAVAMCGGVMMPDVRHHRQAISGAESQLSRRLRELALGDSLRALANAGRGVKSSDGMLVVLHEAPLSDDSARAWLSLAVAERDRITAGPPRVRIVLALESAPHRRPQDLRTLESRRMYVFGPATQRFTVVAGHDTTCFVTLRLNSMNRPGAAADLVGSDSRGRYGAFLGSCGLVGQFGMPGVGAQAAMRYAMYGDRSSSYMRRSTMVPVQSSEPREIASGPYQFAGCMRGDEGACASLAGLEVEGRRSVNRLTVPREFLAWLQASEGPEKFGRFWRSPRVVEVAMAEAFGRPAEETFRGWLRHDYRIVERDKPGTGSVALAALGWLAAALILAVAVGSRRQVT